MFAWLSANLATIVVAVILAAVLTAVIWYMISQKKKGISSCGGKCGSCPMGCSCHGTTEKK